MKQVIEPKQEKTELRPGDPRTGGETGLEGRREDRGREDGTEGGAGTETGREEDERGDRGREDDGADFNDDSLIKDSRTDNREVINNSGGSEDDSNDNNCAGGYVVLEDSRSGETSEGLEEAGREDEIGEDERPGDVVIRAS
ncbi:hypothetical protein N431DRAFT_450005 [Stipitochalara longipes BDJ]|nr:hypothetical protein N431DRAFT_450005 [Stipitochalara longipes BDJ]